MNEYQNVPTDLNMGEPIFDIAPRQLQSLINRGAQPHLIDVRMPVEYRVGHAEGAVQLPLHELNPATYKRHLRKHRIFRNEPVFLICKSGSRARKAAQLLTQFGQQKIGIVAGGTEAWRESGLPLVRCGNAMSLKRQVQIAIGVLLITKVVFGFTVHELFFAAPALIGVGLIVAGITKWCGLARLLGMMPWNRTRTFSELEAV